MDEIVPKIVFFFDRQSWVENKSLKTEMHSDCLWMNNNNNNNKAF
jgi:hypothetical protein